MNLEIVHDVETQATSIDAIILSIGAVLVDTTTGEVQDRFYRRIRTDSQPGRVSDQKTIDWWEAQSFEAYAEAIGRERQYLPRVLVEYNDWICQHPDAGIWGNGSDFDNAILQHAFRNHNIKWPYWRNRCLRSLRALVGGEKLPWPEILTKHVAIDDARYEAAEITELLRRYQNKFCMLGAEAMREAMQRWISGQIDGYHSLSVDMPETKEACLRGFVYHRIFSEALEGMDLQTIISGKQS